MMIIKYNDNDNNDNDLNGQLLTYGSTTSYIEVSLYDDNQI